MLCLRRELGELALRGGGVDLADGGDHLVAPTGDAPAFVGAVVEAGSQLVETGAQRSGGHR